MGAILKGVWKEDENGNITLSNGKFYESLSEEDIYMFLNDDDGSFVRKYDETIYKISCIPECGNVGIKNNVLVIYGEDNTCKTFTAFNILKQCSGLKFYIPCNMPIASFSQCIESIKRSGETRHINAIIDGLNYRDDKNSVSKILNRGMIDIDNAIIVGDEQSVFNLSCECVPTQIIECKFNMDYCNELLTFNGIDNKNNKLRIKDYKKMEYIIRHGIGSVKEYDEMSKKFTKSNIGINVTTD